MTHGRYDNLMIIRILWFFPKSMWTRLAEIQSSAYRTSAGIFKRVPGPSASASPENLLETQMLGSYHRCTESETLGWGPAIHAFTSPASHSDATEVETTPQKTHR